MWLLRHGAAPRENLASSKPEVVELLKSVFMDWKTSELQHRATRALPGERGALLPWELEQLNALGYAIDGLDEEPPP